MEISARKMFAALFLGIAIAASATVCRVDSPTLRKGSVPAEADTLCIGPAVKTIAAYALADHQSLTTVVCEPGALTGIEKYAFLGCTGLREVNLPPTLVSLGEGCFRECSALTEMSLPRGISRIPAYTFLYCTSLRQISLPASLREIGRSAFCECTALQSVALPAGLKKVGMNCFSLCSSLREISFPASVTDLGSYVCSECTALESVTLPANRSLLGELMFIGCRSLRTITEGCAVPPPFDCHSTIFNDDETDLYSRCTLKVPAQAVQAYRRAQGWRLFQNIEAK